MRVSSQFDQRERVRERVRAKATETKKIQFILSMATFDFEYKKDLTRLYNNKH